MKKILILSANPKDTTRLRLDEEIREIQEGLKRSKNRSHFTIHQSGAIRLKDIRRALLDEEPQIVHFCGHGKESGIMIEDDNGNALLVNPEALAELFELFSDKVECVLLNACYSESQADAMREHINYIIGMREKIGDKTAIEFAIGFYDALGAGKDYEEAFKFGCNAIRLYNLPEHLTPVLKTRVESHPLPEEQEKARSLIQIILKEDIRNFDETLQKTFVETLANVLDMDKRSIKILKMAPGSLWVTVALPTDNAQALINLFKTKSKKINPLMAQFHVKGIQKVPDIPHRPSFPWILICCALLTIITGFLWNGVAKQLVLKEVLITRLAELNWGLFFISAILAVLTSGFLWNFLNRLLTWPFYMGGSGNEPHGVQAFIWGFLPNLLIIGFAFVGCLNFNLIFGGSYFQNPHLILFSCLEGCVLSLFYSIFGGLGAVLFYDGGFRNFIEAKGFKKKSQEIIIATIWSCVLALSMYIPLLLLYPLSRGILHLGFLVLIVPSAVFFSFIAVGALFIIEQPTDDIRGIVAASGLRVGLFVGLTCAIILR